MLLETVAFLISKYFYRNIFSLKGAKVFLFVCPARARRTRWWAPPATCPPSCAWAGPTTASPTSGPWAASSTSSAPSPGPSTPR